MSTLFNAIIEEMEVTQAKETWDAYWMEAIKESEDMENAEISFESIVDGDNAVKKGLSGIVRWLSSLGSNNKKLAWDMSIFEKIDKSKISKDVTGVATPEYVKTFTDCINSMKLLNESDIAKIKEIAETLKKDPKAPRNFLRGVALVLSILSGLGGVTRIAGARTYIAIVTAFGTTMGAAITTTIIGILGSIFWAWLWYFISKNNIDGTSTSRSEVNTLLDILAKLQNHIIGIEGSEITDATFSKVDSLIASLKAPGSTTISVADQNKVADMLLEVSKAKDQVKNSIPTINKQGALGSIYSIGSELKRGFKGIDQDIIDKCNKIIMLTTKVNTYMDALAGASKTIAADIRKW
jgi:hypothetical protein